MPRLTLKKNNGISQERNLRYPIPLGHTSLGLKSTRLTVTAHFVPDLCGLVFQGRRHGFESGGQILFDPTFWGQNIA